MRIKEMDYYQEEAFKTAVYPQLKSNLVYPAMGLSGEAGELGDKIKKIWRNSGEFPSINILTMRELEEIEKELGDVLWYVAAIASELRLSLSSVAYQNLYKLRDRANRNVIKSSGDNR